MTLAIAPDEIWSCALARWSPGIGDPTAMGWVTVAFYAATGAFCLALSLRRKPEDWRFWAGLSLLMLALAVNKQLDLQSALTAVGRCVAQLQGWYGARRGVQFAFILGVLGAGALMTAILLWRMRGHFGGAWGALLGISLLLTFIAMRAVGFHHFDAFISLRVSNIRVNWILELGGIGLILLNALARLLSARRPAPVSPDT